MWDRATNRRINRLFIVFLLVLGAMWTSSTAHAQIEVGSTVAGEHAFRDFIESCADPCVIKHNDGGAVVDFVGAAKWVRSHHMYIQFDGPCASACASFADLVRPNACVTENAIFLFHRMRYPIIDPRTNVVTAVVIPDATDPRGVPPQAQDVKDWVYDNGGFPIDGVTYMTASEVAGFWPVCRHA